MSSELYSPTVKERINPEFVGIAKKYSNCKQKRQQLQQERDQHLRSLKYKMSVDLQLSKNIDEQQHKLHETKSTYHRKVTEKELKQERAEIKKNKLRSLSTMIKEKREDAKRNVRNAKLLTFKNHRRSRIEDRHLQELIETKIQENNYMNSMKNKRRFSEVKHGEKHSQNMVNKFYRTLNKDSLQTYQQVIAGEGDQAQQYEEEIKAMEVVIGKYDQAIERKKDKIVTIFSEIETYTAESTLEQSKCLPLYLRGTHSMTASQSSRPKDLLLRGAKEMPSHKPPSSFS